MSRFTITIAPEGDATGANTVVTVDASNGTPRIAELTIRGGENGIDPNGLPQLDLGALVQVLAGGASASAPAAIAAAPAVVADEPVAAPRKRAEKTPRKPRTPKDAAKSSDDKATDGGGRTYRRMPEPEEVLAAYRQAGSITALADHFGVPRHTAQGWAARLRKQGHELVAS